MEQLEKVFLVLFDPIEPFGDYIKTIEEAMRSTEATGCLHASKKVATKACNQGYKSRAMSLDCREQKQKPIVE